MNAGVKKGRTALLIEFGEKTKDIFFEDDATNTALENDYADNPDLYDENTLSHLKIVHLLNDKLNPEELASAMGAYWQYRPEPRPV